MSEALKKLAKKGVAAIGVSPDPADRQKRFDDKHGLGFPLLADVDNDMAKAYGAWGVNNMAGKKKEGIIRSSFLIDEKGKIAGAWYKVKPEDTVPKALSLIGG